MPVTRCRAAARRRAGTTAPRRSSAPRGGVRLVQNHEIGASDPIPTLAAPELTYDPKAKGGTTTLTLDQHLDRVDEYVSLAGTGRTAPAASRRGARG